jgi:rubrerythrin
LAGINDDMLQNIARAIGEEEAARVFYAEMASRLKNPDARATFARLSDEEAQHKADLMELFESITGKPFGEVIAAGRIRQAIGTVRDTTTAVDALRLAQHAEKDAYEMYTRMGVESKDDKSRNLFEMLAKMEWRHWEILEGEIKALTDTAADDAIASAGLEY